MRTSAALYVRQWLAKLHPPLPQTPRDSQQLLRILESSFQKHLDESHPPPAQRSEAHAATPEISLASPTSASTATQHYFNSVLNHPLLAKADVKSNSNASTIANALSVFAKASTDGSVTLPLLRQCAENYLRGVKKGEKLAANDGFADKLASWVFTTSSPMRKAFFASKEALDLAVRVSGVDGKEAIVWEWLRTVYERGFVGGDVFNDVALSSPKWLEVEDYLVSCLMRMSISRSDLEDAAQQFLQASQYRISSGRAATRPELKSDTLSYLPLEQSWKRLAASIVHFRQRHGISTDLFEQLLCYGMPWNLVPHFSIPVVLVYHPKSPSATSLSQHLQNTNQAEQFLSGQVAVSKRFRRAMLMMILDAAQLSLEQRTRNQAQFFLEFAHKHYAEFLPPKSAENPPSLDTQIRKAQEELKAHAYNFAWT